jgi:hypothetical protein
MNIGKGGLWIGMEEEEEKEEKMRGGEYWEERNRRVYV